MKLSVILSTIPVLAVLGCGSDNGKFTLSSGTYKLSNTSAVAPDNCGLATAFKDGDSIQITVAGANATFAFGPVDPNRNPVATIDGNNINSGSKTFDVNDNDPSIPPLQRVDCVETITETTTGSLVANDQDDGALLYNSAMKSGTQCTAQYLGYKAYPCSSTLSFMAKKQ